MSDEHSVALSIIQREWNIWFWTKFPVSGFGGAISYSDYHDFFEIKSCLCIRKYLPIYWCKVITVVQIEKVELKFCERIRNRRMRKEDAYMASMQSFAMRASFQLPVEIVLGGDRPVKSETFMIWMRVLIDNAPMSEKTKDQLVCMLIMSGFVILFWGIKGYREKKKTEE